MSPVFSNHPILRRFKNSLALRYLGIASTCLIGIQLLLGVFQSQRNFTRQIDRIEQKAEVQAKFLSEVAPEAIFGLDFLYLETLMRQTSEDADIVYAIVVSEDGRALTRYLNRTDRIVTQALEDIQPNEDLLKVIKAIHRHRNIHQVRATVLSNNKPLGEIRLGYSVQNVLQESRQAAVMILATSILVSIVLATLTIVLFNREVRKPLQNLAALAQALAAGDLKQRVQVTQEDEIGQLGAAFNSMAVQLQQTLQGLALARDEALAASRAKSEFLANMSHELRTPLNAILGFTQLMSRETSLQPTQRETLDVINRSGEQLLSLINDVLDMAKIEAGRTSVNLSNFDCHQLLDSLYDLFDLRARSKGIQLVFEYDREVPRYLRSDLNKLRQVLVNLVGNGVKFTDRGSVTLRVEARPTETNNPTQDGEGSRPWYTLFFEVEDTGPGIPAEAMETIFEAFVQTEIGRQTQQGTGLGLPISRKYVQLMGGDLTIDSQLDRGSTFKFAIQAQEAEAVEVESEPIGRVIGLAPDQPNYRILVVEDAWESRHLLVKLLELVGFEVQEAENGMDAMEVWQRWSPDLIWMDMRMPVMDGYEATRQIREAESSALQGLGERSPVAILALTAFAFEEQQRKAIAAGCDDYIRKPFQEWDIFEKMGQYLGVRYLFERDLKEEENKDEKATEAPVGQLDPIASEMSLEQQIAAMPAEWIAQLHEAAMALNEKHMVTLIEQIGEKNRSLAQGLMDLIDEFRFEQVAELTRGD